MTIVYLLTNIAYIAVVGGERILTSGAVAMVSVVTKDMCRMICCNISLGNKQKVFT